MRSPGLFQPVRWLCIFLVAAGTILPARALPSQFGDLDEDGQITILDIVRLVSYYNRAATVLPNDLIFADLNQDGAISDEDLRLLRDVILGQAVLPTLPLTSVRSTSPQNGELDVAVMRETVINLTFPLSTNALVTVDRLNATFGGRRILSRVEISSDRRRVTLFYLEPLPNGARIRVAFDVNGLTDFLNRPLDGDGDGAPGGTYIFDFDTVNLAAIANTIINGRVFASELKPVAGSSNQFVNVPLAGVTITVDGVEESLRAVTDQFGNFRLAPVPGGTFYVHIDGRTVTNLAAGIRYPDLAYYPNVNKKWESVPQQEVNLGEIYLPLIAAQTLKPVSMTQDTVLAFSSEFLAANPQFIGVAITIPAGSLYSESGTRGGLAGIAPVPPDRLPGPVPEGLPIQDVVTVQTDGGGNFDTPAPACFPNLPDPATGEKLPPGAKSALWSFNHDTGQFEIVGSMTVSEDGRLVCTDPGVGILAPGWHGTAPGSVACGGPMFAGEDDPESPYEKPTQHRPPGAPTKKDPCDKSSKGCGGSQEDDVADPIYFFSGEFYESHEDMRIKGRGMDFVWARKYRSKTGVNSRQGNGWDCSYNIFIEPAGLDLMLCDGNSRTDIYPRQPDGTWTQKGFFREFARNPDGTYTLTFEDKGQWNFNPLDGTPQAGRIASSIDRHGNRMGFAYDAQGRLNRVTDTLDRDIMIDYNGQGFIASVTDFAGRSVRYAYYNGIEPGGSLGDLKSVTTPSVIGTPNGNDFPNGKITTYTYSTGFADERLNHNLLTITDGRRNDPNDPTFGTGPYLINIYAASTDPADPNFDRVVRQIWGGDIIDIVYIPLQASSVNRNTIMRTIVNDRVGNVHEYFFDKKNRLILQREFTGRANPREATTDVNNRPKDKLRPDDPACFETIYEWTEDSLQRRIIHPNGNITEYVYEVDLNPNTPARSRGNVRVSRHLPGSHQPAGDQQVIEELFEYDTSFQNGCCGFNFVTKHTDARGNVTRKSYDPQGNLVEIQHRSPGIMENFEYNQFGQITRLIHPDNGSGHRRVDQFIYYTQPESDDQEGYLKQLVVDAGNLNLTTSYEYDKVGNVIRTIDPRGHDTMHVYNALDQVVRVISVEVRDGSNIRHRKDTAYDANNNILRVDVQNLDENGQLQANTHFTTLYEYEVLNNPTRVRYEVDENRNIAIEYGYDANRNRVLTREGEATAQRQAANVIRKLYDERDMLFREVRAPGDTLQRTTQHDYDQNGNLKRLAAGLEQNPRVYVYSHDGYDREVSTTDPMGNVTLSNYDPHGNVVRLRQFGEVEDIPGAANNVLLTDATFVFDAANREVEKHIAFFNTGTGTAVGDGLSSTYKAYSANSQLLRVVDDLGRITLSTYDTANRAKVLTDAKGNTLSYDYDANDNMIRIIETHKSDSGNPAEVFTTVQTFDNLNRLTRTVDSAGNTFDYGYDSRGNRVLMADALRTAPNAPGNITSLT